ncbi:hypothetical protein CC78DRAFT_534845 [Lojkania enalia]|uniref:DUF6593 domain-containing protein n=1 Tax=Lojkania enalia TaxID=147567 RepID=A0A9P4K5T2_9PLEO|nr:hypothetical protein CC78DRAFT_534845 [Didymosphaeria enalia]
MEYPVYAEDGWRGRKAVWIKHSDKDTDAYHVDFRGSADMIVRRGGMQGPIVGKIDFHNFSNYVEIHFENNERVEMRRDGLFSRTQIVDLPAAPGPTRFAWKSTLSHGSKFGGNLKLEDSNGQVLALFAHSCGMRKDGTLTIVVFRLQQSFLDQVIVSFMAVEEKQRRQAISVAAGGASC